MPGVEFVARAVFRSFDGGLVSALAGVDLTIGAGEQIALVGPTGCGKSTLISLLSVLDEPDRGTIEIDGVPACELASPEEWRAGNLGIVFQFHHLLPHLTVEENVLLPLAGRCRSSVARIRAGDVIELIGLRHRARTLAANLSGGERQLAALARALVGRPRAVLADEPTGSVDLATGKRVMELLTSWSREAEATLLVATHDPAIAASMDRIVSMRDGRIVSAGASQITTRAATERTVCC
jgi:ABC-type lipoprotein export system ATPase subunit